VPRYTHYMHREGAKPRAQVLAEPILVNSQTKRDFRLSACAMFDDARANGLVTPTPVVVATACPKAHIRGELMPSLTLPDTYGRHQLPPRGLGQRARLTSPARRVLAASDSFLVLAVTGGRELVWMPTATLVRGMRTFDTV